MIERTVGFIGAGVMAEALTRGLIKSEVARARDICASDPSSHRREVFRGMIGQNTFAQNGKVVERSEVIVLAVKPGMLPTVADDIAPEVTTDHLVVSIVPGVTLKWLHERLGTARLIRIMPNTPALVEQGAAAFCRGARANDADASVVRQMLSAVGQCEEVEEELMDAVTGLSGSGPAYAYMMIEALSDGGVKMGLPRRTATRLAAQTLKGAAEMVLDSTVHPGALKDQVATPGGTTIAAVHALEKAGLRSALMDAVEAATRRSKELGEQ